MDADDQTYLSIQVSHSIMGVAASVAIGLRFLARRKTKSLLGWDDWSTLFAGLLMWANFITTIMEYNPALKHPPSESENEFYTKRLMLLSSISSFFTAACETVTRLAVIFLFYRLFSVQVWLSHCLKAIAYLSLPWPLMAAIGLAVQKCRWPDKHAEALVPARCPKVMLAFLAGEGLSLLLDSALVVLPTSTILRLRLPLKERLGIILIFLTGGLLIITQILRIVFGYDGRTGRVRSLEQLSTWTCIHLGVGVICACLPLFRVYLPKEGSLSYRTLKCIYIATGLEKIVEKPLPGRNGTLPSFVRPHSETKIAQSSSDQAPIKNEAIVSDVEKLESAKYGHHI